jgi:hypothetical protein
LALLLTLQVRYPVAYLWLARKPVIFDELTANWQVKNDAGTGPQESGYRLQLVQFLSSAYGDPIAEQTADGFFNLWRYAHSEAVQVSRFADQGELQAYMRITGLVDEDRAHDAAKSQPPTGRETVDRSFLAPEDWDKDPEGPDGENDLTTSQVERPMTEDEEDDRAGQLRLQCADIVNRWNDFANTGVFRAAWALPGLLRKANHLPWDASRMRASVERFLGRTTKSQDELHDFVDQLKDIGGLRAYRHVSEVALVFCLCWPIAMVLLGTAVRLLWGAMSVQLDPASQFVQIGNQIFSPPEGPAWDLANPIQVIVQLPSLFPGGPLFFWAAIIYVLAGLVIWWKARAQLRDIQNQSSD